MPPTHGAPPPPGHHPPPPHGLPDDDDELSAAVEHMRVSCLEVRVRLGASSDHGEMAGKKLDLADEQLHELRAHEDEEARAPGPGKEPLREERLARARANKKRETGESEGGSDWKQRCEAAEQALGKAQAEITRLQAVLVPVYRDTAPPPPPLARMRTASRETMQLIEGLEAEGKFVEAAELLAEQLEALKRVQDGAGASPPPLTLETFLSQPLHSSGARSHATPLRLAEADPGDRFQQKGSTSFPPDGIVQNRRRQWSDTDRPS